MEAIKKNTVLNELGSFVTIDITKIEDRIPKRLIEQIRKDPVGEIIDYKMTDGTGIGIVIKFKNGKQSWFFEEEIENKELAHFDNSYEHINEFNSNLGFTESEKTFSTKKNIVYLINPINFINWLIYSTNDIF